MRAPSIFPLLSLALFAACAEAPEEAPEQRVIPAAVASVSPAAGTETLSIAGTVRLRRETALGFTTAGKVASVRFDEGDPVRRGTVLASLDTSTVAADLEAARAERDRAQAQLDRIQSLYKDGWVTKAQLEQTEAAARAASARVEATGFARNTARIVAPGSGILLTRNIDVGQIVPAGMTALVLGETDKGFVLRVPMTGRDAARVQTGMGALVRINALGGEAIPATVAEKDGRADPATGTFEVNFALPADQRLRSGQLGTVEISVEREADGALAIPAKAIFDLRAGEGLVYVVDKDDVVSPRNVIVGELLDDVLLIREGLDGSETIVVEGIEKLQPGDKIRPVNRAG